MKLPVPIRVDAGNFDSEARAKVERRHLRHQVVQQAQRRDRRYFARAGIGQPLGIFSINH
ncbi:MAG: hypothetical protein WCB78_03350 [Pseudolabrys sp.]